MSNKYCENTLIQGSAAKLLQDTLSWEVVYAYNDEVLGEKGTFGRKSYREVILPKYFAQALKKLNTWITDKQIAEAKAIMEAHLSTASLLEINEEKYKLIRDGVKVTVVNDKGEATTKTAVLIDFDNVEANSFLAVQELKITGTIHNRRTDIVGFVNGIPLLFVELKKQNVDIYNAYADNYRDYQETIPQLFYYNAFLILSNGLDAKIGTLDSKYEFFHEWKRLAEEEAGVVALKTMLLGVCKKENFLDLLENFILYDHANGKTAKILARNHQYLGVNKAVEKYERKEFQNGKLGVFWHTQGSGKSYSMIFFAQKIKRKLTGSPTFVILTDREELNKQISGTFESCGVLGNSKASSFVASSGKDLVEKLHGNPSFIFTLIHKFNQKDLEPIIPNHDIIIISDEAHRSQYGDLADNMCNLLPSASRIGFTGTPIFGSNDLTARTFGEYISVYDFKRAVEDGATVPLYYENRGDKIQNLQNPEITQEILDAIENADLDDSQKEKLEQEFANEIHLLTAEPRLRSIAHDFVKHYTDLWESGKAMFVCLNKVTCVRMYNYVQEYWDFEMKLLEKQIEKAMQQEALELERKLRWMQETEMAVVVSDEQNEEEKFRKWNCDIVPHREKMFKRELDKEFKEASNPFRIVFVCAMWLTGFDVKTLSCLYLDKPMKAHTLMQTIARANRVAEGKTNGLIVDYIGIIKALRKALAEYTNTNKGDDVDPTIDKDELLKRVMYVITKIREFLSNNGFDLDSLINADDFDKVELLPKAKDALNVTIEVRKSYQTQVLELKRLLRYLNREEVTPEIKANKDAIIAIFEMLQEQRRHVDTTDVMVAINEIINQHIALELKDGKDESKKFDLSQIDFNVLRAEFARVKHKNTLLRDLENLIEIKLAEMVFSNPNRIDYYKRYNEIIDEYNADKDRAAIEKTFEDLINLSKSMDDEMQRYVREQFDNDRQLAIYDLLFSDKLSASDIKEIKAMAKEMYNTIKEMIDSFDHWRDKEETKAQVETKIIDIFYEKAPDSIYPCHEYYEEKIFEYFYNTYEDIA